MKGLTTRQRIVRQLRTQVEQLLGDNAPPWGDLELRLGDPTFATEVERGSLALRVHQLGASKLAAHWRMLGSAEGLDRLRVELGLMSEGSV